MARLNISPRLLSETRFAVFSEVMGYDRRTAVGTLVLIWIATRERPGPRISYDNLCRCLPCPPQDRGRLIDALESSGFARTTDDALYEIIDNVRFFEAMDAWQACGRNGGLAKARNAKAEKAKRSTQYDLIAQHKEEEPVANNANAIAWEHYRAAYLQTWAVEPIHSERVGRQIAKVVGQLGAQLAGPVLAFYVRHTEPLYVRRQHDVALALRDISGLATQYRRAEAIARGEVREIAPRPNTYPGL